VHGRALDACHFTGRRLDDLGVETMCLGPPQIHAQQHLGPVLCLRAARTGLNVEVCIAGVHFAREHAPELETRQQGFEAFEVMAYLGESLRVVLLGGEIIQLRRVPETRRQLVERVDDLFQASAFLSQRLGAFGLVPDVGLLEFASDLGQSFGFAFVVKDTPSTHRSVP